jgi:hypothetical protein
MKKTNDITRRQIFIFGLLLSTFSTIMLVISLPQISFFLKELEPSSEFLKSFLKIFITYLSDAENIASLRGFGGLFLCMGFFSLFGTWQNRHLFS